MLTHRNPWQLLIIGFLGGVVVAGVGFWQWQRISAPYLIETYTEETSSISENNAEEDNEGPEETIIIHLAGAVKNPGLIHVPATFRLGEAVDKAGGALEEADLNRLNLAIVLEDGARYYIPALDESSMMAASETQTKPVENGKLDLNSAQLTDLTELPQIGESRAKAILEYRQKQGRFHSTEEIMKVPGIGEGIYAVIRDQITVR